MIQRSELIEIGTFRKPHGVNGEISAVADVDTALLTRFSCVVVSIDGIFVPFFIANARPKSGETVLLQIDGISSEAEASALVNKDFYVLKNEYSTICDPEGDDMVTADYFIGFKVVDSDSGDTIGDIVDIDDTTQNVLFIVSTPQGKEVMIPAADELIEGIDAENETIEMIIDEGLLDL